MAVLIGFMGFYVLYPLILILINSFNTATIAEPPVYGLKAWKEAFNEPGIWRSLWNSVKIGIALQVIALPTGIFLSWLLARTNIYFANAFEFGFWVSFSAQSGDHLRLDVAARSKYGLDQQLAAQHALPQWTELRHLFLLGNYLGARHGQWHFH